MNTNKNADSSRDANDELYVCQTVRKDGLITYSVRHTNNTVYFTKTPYVQHKSKSQKGLNGLSKQEKEYIRLSVHTFVFSKCWTNSWTNNTSELQYNVDSKLDIKSNTTLDNELDNDNELNKCLLRYKWLILTFDNSKSNYRTSDEGLINILKNLKELYKSIKRRLKKLYDTLPVKFPFEPCIVVYGLRERTSHGRKIPCFDINILCLTKDEYGNDLFNVEKLVQDIYVSASYQAGERIEIPSDYYCNPPNNTLSNYRQFASYLQDQIDEDVLRRFQQSEYAPLLPNTWIYIPRSLIKTFNKVKNNYPESTIKKHKELLQSEEFSNDVTIQDIKDYDYKCTVQINNQSPEAINSISIRGNK